MKRDSSGNVIHGMFGTWGDCTDVWKLENAGGGYYALVNTTSRIALEVENGSNTVGANVTTGDKTSADKQKFLIKPMDDGSYQILPSAQTIPR